MLFKLCFFIPKKLVLVLLLPEFAIDLVKLPNRHRPLLNEGWEEVGSHLKFCQTPHL